MKDFDKIEQSDELLVEAYETEDKREAERLAKQALKLNPDNVDAKIFLAARESNPQVKLMMFSSIIKEEEARLKREGFFEKENIGQFWSIIETRPYMRALFGYREELDALNQNTNAIKVSERMLELCESDNMGVRDNLMAEYAIQENLAKAEELLAKYPHDKMVLFLLPYAVCCYRCNEYDKCDEILNKISKSNKYAQEILSDIYSALDETPTYSFSVGKKEEVYAAVEVCRYLFDATDSFIDYAEEFFTKRNRSSKK